MKTLIDQNVLTEKFVIGWFDKSFRLDKESALYDKKAEKKYRDLIETFVNWLKNADSESGSDSSSDNNEEDKNEKGKILRGHTLKLQHIDTSQIISPKKLLGSLEWVIDDYKADGILIENLYKLNPSAHKYIPKVLCYYNFLD